MRRPASLGRLFGLLLALPVSARAGSIGFTRLGFLDSSSSGGAPRSEAYGISSDGSTVVGFSKAEGSFRGFRWTAAGGMISIGALDSLNPYSDALAISGDGSTIVGESRFGDSMVAHRWTASGGIQAFGFPLGGTSSSTMAVSANGQFIAGYTDSGSARQGFRWSASTGIQVISSPPFLTQPNGISADGSIIVGTNFASGNGAFIWDAANGIRSLNDVTPSAFVGASAWAITPDGKWVVGSGDQAFRWNAATGFQPLGVNFIRAMAVSADGNIVVGDNPLAGSQQAYIWDPVGGARELKTFLVTDLGLNLDGWTLTFASSISADGTVITGVGTNPEGQREAWVAVVPEPAGLSAIISILMALQFRRARRPDS